MPAETNDGKSYVVFEKVKTVIYRKTMEAHEKVIPVKETITGKNGVLRVKGKPATPYGFDGPVAYVKPSRDVLCDRYDLSEDGTVIDFTPKRRTKYDVYYWTEKAVVEIVLSPITA